MKGWYTSNGGLLGCRNAKQQLRRNNESCHYKYTRWLQQHRSLVRGRRGNRVNNDKVCTTSKPQTFRHYCLTQFAMTCFWTTSVVYCSLSLRLRVVLLPNNLIRGSDMPKNRRNDANSQTPQITCLEPF